MGFCPSEQEKGTILLALLFTKQSGGNTSKNKPQLYPATFYKTNRNIFNRLLFSLQLDYVIEIIDCSDEDDVGYVAHVQTMCNNPAKARRQSFDSTLAQTDAFSE